MTGGHEPPTVEDLAEYATLDEAFLVMLAVWPGWQMLCYGQPAAEYATLAEAFLAANQHILTCPHGPMPWATDVRWVLAEVTGSGWLNHILEPIVGDDGTPTARAFLPAMTTTPVQDPPASTPPVGAEDVDRAEPYV